MTFNYNVYHIDDEKVNAVKSFNISVLLQKHSAFQLEMTKVFLIDGNERIDEVYPCLVQSFRLIRIQFQVKWTEVNLFINLRPFDMFRVN